MKTVDEAIDAVIIPCKTPDEIERAVATCNEDLARHRSIIEEILRHNRVTATLAFIVASKPQGEAIFDTLILGVRLGMELERSDTGGVAGI